MKIDFNPQTTIKQLPKRALEGINSVGEGVIGFCKEKNDSFAKTSVGEFCKEHNLNKNTFIGTVILATASTLAIKCILGIKDKIREIKEN